MSCLNCTIKTPHTKEKCPYYKQCKLCGEEGHIKKECPFGDEKSEKSENSNNGSENSKPKLTKRQSTYLFIAYTLARFNSRDKMSVPTSQKK